MAKDTAASRTHLKMQPDHSDCIYRTISLMEFVVYC